MDKEKFIAYAKYYTIFKIIFNAIVIMSIVSLISSNYGISNFTLPLTFSLIYYPYTIIETYLLVSKVNKYRNVRCWTGDFWRYWSMGIVVNTAAIGLIIVLIQKLETELFMLFLYLFIVVFPWLQAYVSSIGQQGVKTELYLKKLSEQYNIKPNVEIYVFKGKLNKNANAYVKGLLKRKRIMISDYLIENLTEKEVCAILCHEISHCLNYDVEVSVMMVNSISLILIVMGYLFEAVNMTILQGVFIAVITIMSLTLFLMTIRRAQEYKADRYVVDITEDCDIFESALQKLYELNSTMKQGSTLFSLFETHPQLEKRVQKLRIYYNKQRK